MDNFERNIPLYPPTITWASSRCNICVQFFNCLPVALKFNLCKKRKKNMWNVAAFQFGQCTATQECFCFWCMFSKFRRSGVPIWSSKPKPISKFWSLSRSKVWYWYNKFVFTVLYVHSLMLYKGYICNNKSLIQIKDLGRSNSMHWKNLFTNNNSSVRKNYL